MPKRIVPSIKTGRTWYKMGHKGKMRWIIGEHLKGMRRSNYRAMYHRIKFKEIAS